MKTATIGLAAVAVVVGASITLGVIAGQTHQVDEPTAAATPEQGRATGGEASAFLALLDYIPAREDAALYYSDYAAARGIMGVQAPSQDAAYGEVIDYWLSLLKVGLRQNPIAEAYASAAQAMNSALGFNIANLDQSLFVGQYAGGGPCSVSHVLAGRFDEARMDNAIREISTSRKAVTRDVHNGVPYFSLPASCSISDSFGGPGSLVIGPDLVYWNGEPGADLETMIDASAGAIPSLAGTPAYQRLAQSFAELGVFTAYVQVYVDDTWLEHRLEQAFDDYGQDAVEAAGHLEPAFELCDPYAQGISSGWGETYEAWLPGQMLDITNLPDGSYALRTILDPDNLLMESDETNNEYVLDLIIEGNDVNPAVKLAEEAPEDDDSGA